MLDLLPGLVDMLANDLDLLGTTNELLQSYYIHDANAVLQVVTHSTIYASRV